MRLTTTVISRADRRSRGLLDLRWLLASFVVLAAWVPAQAQLQISGETTVDVTPSGFSVIWEASEPSSPGISVYSDAAGTVEITNQLEVTAFPVVGGDPLAADELAAAAAVDALRSAARSLGLMKVRVRGASAGTTYYYRVSSSTPTETAEAPSGPPAAVTTTLANSFITRSNQILLTVNVPDARGWLTTATSLETLHPVSAYVGDGAGNDQAFLNLSELFETPDGNWDPAGTKQLTLEVRRGGGDSTTQNVELVFASGFAVSTLYQIQFTGDCGNGLPDPGEECDDGNQDNTDSCLNDCTDAACGDGFVWSGVEQCDDGNQIPGDGCENDCTTTCPDADGDGFGDPGDPICSGGPETDCAPLDPTVFPGAPQLCDGLNNDCSDVAWPTVPSDETDDDLDGFSECQNDCDDDDLNRYPGAPEICNGVDDDCDSLVDEDDLGEDTDADGTPNACDNCPVVVNADQSDADLDLLGDACDNCPEEANVDQLDSDVDLVGDVCDNCPVDFDAGQEDLDRDGLGDECDDDVDGDGILNENDNCPRTPNFAQEDNDLDEFGDLCDNCPTIANPGQEDGDRDQRGDVCDNCEFMYNPSQSDLDTDAEGDACDLDDGLIFVTFSEPLNIGWQQEAGFDSWNVYTGSLDVLRDTEVYTQVPGSNPIAAQDCGLGVTSAATPTLVSGDVAFFLITGTAGGVESSLGMTSEDIERLNLIPCVP